MAYFSPEFFEFFAGLAENNNKPWFDTNRKLYERSVKKPFADFVAEMIDRIRMDDPSVDIAPKDAIFRINRDIRFAKDKTPYKTSVSALISSAGRKDKTTPGIYFEFSPENVRVYGGAHMLDTAQLRRVRTFLAENLDDFEQLLQDEAFRSTFGTLRGEAQKRVPKELAPALEQQPLIANKQFYYFAKADARKILDDDLADWLMAYYHAGKPINQFLRRSLA